MALLEVRDELEKSVMAFQAGDSTWQNEESLFLGRGEFVEPLTPPIFGRLVAMWKLVRVHALMNHSKAMGRNLGIILEDVVLHRMGDADDRFSFGHDRGVKIHRVKAVHGGDQPGTARDGKLFPGEIAEPSRRAGAEVEDVGLGLFQQLFDGRHMAERERILAMHLQWVMVRASRFELVDQFSPVREHAGLVSGGGEMMGKPQSHLFHPTRVEFG